MDIDLSKNFESTVKPQHDHSQVPVSDHSPLWSDQTSMYRIYPNFGHVFFLVLYVYVHVYFMISWYLPMKWSVPPTSCDIPFFVSAYHGSVAAFKAQILTEHFSTRRTWFNVPRRTALDPAGSMDEEGSVRPPSGKHAKSLERSMGKLIISTGPCSTSMLSHYQRGYQWML